MSIPLIAVSGLLLCVTACGGGGGSGAAGPNTPGNPQTENPGNTLTGRLVDGDVSGVSYATPTHQSETGADGSFSYEPGEVVRFTLGDTLLGEVPAQARVTPFDLAGIAPLTGTSRLDDAIHHDNDPFQTVINLAVLLQSLDADGDPGNGIAITSEVRELLSGVSLDLHQPWASFRQDFAFRRVIGRANAESLFANAHGTKHPAIALKHLYQAADIDPRIYGPSRYEVREDNGSLTAVYTYQYDENGFVVDAGANLDGDNPDSHQNTRWRYDDNGNVTGLSTGSSWFWWQWRYDEFGNLIREEDHYNADEVPERSTVYSYDSSGNLVRSELDSDGNGVVESYRVLEYDYVDRTMEVRSYNGDGTSSDTGAEFRYDERNNLAQAIYPGNDAFDPGPYIQSYKYNERNQLTRIELDDNGDGAAEGLDVWEYDAEGNLVQHQQGRLPAPVTSYAYDAKGRLVREQSFTAKPFNAYLQEWEFHDTYTQYTMYYDADGDTVADTTQVRREHFDSDGTILHAENDIDGDGDWDVTYNFDANGNLEAPGRTYQPTAWGHLFSSLRPRQPVVTLYPTVQRPQVQASCCRNPL